MMRIGALQKTTMLDFPGKLSAIVFTRGCNFRCPYCHNPGLLNATAPLLDMSAVLNFLRQRRRVLGGVVITGGEPTLQAGLGDFCAALKRIDPAYAIKLDTNGSRPEVLSDLLSASLLDYVAVDLKTDPARYAPNLSPVDVATPLRKSIDILKASGIAYEFRVTCVFPFVSSETFPAMLEAMGDNPPLFLQTARLDAVLRPDFFPNPGRALTPDEMTELRDMAVKRGLRCEVR